MLKLINIRNIKHLKHSNIHFLKNVVNQQLSIYKRKHSVVGCNSTTTPQMGHMV